MIPIGVKLVAFVHFLFALWCGLVGVLCTLSGAFGSGSSGGFLKISPAAFVLFGLVLLALGGGFSLVGAGLLRRKAPARWAAVVLSVVALFLLWGTGSWIWQGIHALMASYLAFSSEAGRVLRN